METKIQKISTHFYSLDKGDVFSLKGRTSRLFMAIEPTVIRRNGDETVNAVSLTDGELVCTRTNDEVLFYYNARIAL